MSQLYLMVSGNVKNPELLAAYQEKAGPIMKKHGALLPAEKFSVSQVLAGDHQPTFFLRIAFNEIKDITSAFSDPDYTDIIPLRDGAIGDLSIFISSA
ncbi:MAG: DUF1330 domain-containing protein [Verrucomicrobiota bacterium]